jgi:hypothetical protein
MHWQTRSLWRMVKTKEAMGKIIIASLSFAVDGGVIRNGYRTNSRTMQDQR